MFFLIRLQVVACQQSLLKRHLINASTFPGWRCCWLCFFLVINQIYVTKDFFFLDQRLEISINFFGLLKSNSFSFIFLCFSVRWFFSRFPIPIKIDRTFLQRKFWTLIVPVCMYVSESKSKTMTKVACNMRRTGSPLK